MTSPDQPQLQIRQLSFHYPQRRLIDGLTRSLTPGLTIVRGGDGCGKTTLLRLLAGQENAQSGHIRFQGEEAGAGNPAYLQQVYYVDPRTEAFDQMSVPAYLAAVQARFPGFDAAALPELLEGLSLTPHAEKQLFMLSTGSKRKVYLAAALAAGAALNLLDDPFAALDQRSINFLSGKLNALNARADNSQFWIASFYEVPAALDAVALIDLGD